MQKITISGTQETMLPSSFLGIVDFGKINGQQNFRSNFEPDFENKAFLDSLFSVKFTWELESERK